VPYALLFGSEKCSHVKVIQREILKRGPVLFILNMNAAFLRAWNVALHRKNGETMIMPEPEPGQDEETGSAETRSAETVSVTACLLGWTSDSTWIVGVPLGARCPLEFTTWVKNGCITIHFTHNAVAFNNKDNCVFNITVDRPTEHCGILTAPILILPNDDRDVDVDDEMLINTEYEMGNDSEDEENEDENDDDTHSMDMNWDVNDLVFGIVITSLCITVLILSCYASTIVVSNSH